MKRLFVSILALSLAATTATASAQSYGYGQPYPDRYGQSNSSQYDYARVIRVDPVFDSRSGYGNSGYNNSSYNNSGYNQVSNGQNCYEDRSYVGGNDPYYGNSYGNGNGYANNGYGQNDGYYDQYGNRRSVGTAGGSTMATVIGGVVGAVIGSQVGGGSARYATSAIGTMVGGVAGRQIYEQTQRNRTGTVRVCDPVPANGRYASNSYNDRSVNAYNVTYEYAGRQYTTRTNYHPGDRIRVRVDVRPE